jgi:hypothetical protein
MEQVYFSLLHWFLIQKLTAYRFPQTRTLRRSVSWMDVAGCHFYSYLHLHDFPHAWMYIFVCILLLLLLLLYIYILIIYLLVKCEPLYIYMGRWIDCFSIRDLGWMLVEIPLSCIFDRFSMSKIPTMGWIKVRCVSKPRCLWRATDNKTFQAMEWKETKLKPRDMSLLNFLIYIYRIYI